MSMVDGSTTRKACPSYLNEIMNIYDIDKNKLLTSITITVLLYVYRYIHIPIAIIGVY